MTNFSCVEIFYKLFFREKLIYPCASESAKIGPEESDNALRHFHFMQIQLPIIHAKKGLHDQNCMPIQNMYFTNVLVYSANLDSKKNDCFRYYTEPLVSLFISKNNCHLYYYRTRPLTF